jgi:uroporphyrinogen-III synthase
VTVRTASAAELVGCRIAIADDPRPPAADPPVLSEAGAMRLSLAEAGATVVRVPAHRDDRPVPAALRLIVHRCAGGQFDAVVLTGATSARSWVSAMQRLGVADAIASRASAGRLLLVAARPEAALPLTEHRLSVEVLEHREAADLSRVVRRHLAHDGASMVTDAGRVEVRSGGVLVDGRFIPLSRGARAVIEALFLARGRVLTRTEIGRVLPGGERSARAVEVAVARLREALEGVELVQTVVKRGYRLAVSDV